MRLNYIHASALALLTAVVSAGQALVPLNTTPSRIIGHPPEGLSPLTVFPNLIEGRELWQPQGIALDTTVTPNILYVSDYLNNRVLAWKNAQKFDNGQPADLVIGQSDFQRTNAGGPGTAFSAGLNSPMGLAVDRNGNLYVADQLNNRILRYPRPFAQTTGQMPDMAIGQPNFSARTAATTEQGLAFSAAAFPVNLTFDGDGNLWVVDGGNRRVLRYSKDDLATGANGPKANLVIGQSDFTSLQPNVTKNTQTTANVFAAPTGIAFDPAGRLYVSDALPDFSVGRVLVFTPPFSTNQSATRIMGVYTGTDRDVFDKTVMRGPTSIFFLPGSRMGVLDSFSSRILIFETIEKWPDAGASISPQATGFFGQPDFRNRLPNGTTGTYVPAPSSSTFSSPLAAVFTGTELLLTDTGNNRVLAMGWLSGTNSFSPATRVLGQDGFTACGANLVEGREFAFLRPLTSGVAVDAGLALDETGDTPHLYVADTYNHRILGYRDFRKVKAGKPWDKADIVIGQPDFSSNLQNITGNPDGLTAASLSFPTGVLVDSKGDLYVADTGNSRILRFPAPFARPAQLPHADLVLGQRNFTQKITDPSATTMAQPYGMAIVANVGLLASDATHDRVLLFPFNSSGGFTSADTGKPASKVFGQPDFITASSGNGLDKLSSPHHLAADTQGRLYVADTGNNRVVIFDDVSSPIVPATGAFARLTLTGLSQPRGIFLNQVTGEFWVGEANANSSNPATIKRYPAYGQLIFNTTPVFTAYAGQHVLAVAQDQYGDLVVADGSSRVGFYYPALQAVNGGSFLASRNFLAPGMLTSLCAPNSACKNGAALFGPETAALTSFPMPRTLADTQVLFNGEPAPLYAVTPGQINFVVPMKAPQTGTVELQVVQESTGRIYAASTVAMNTVSPAIMMLTYEGQNRQAAVVNLHDGSVNGPSNPAKRGSYVQIYATGQGFVPGAPEDGAAVTGDIRTPGNLRINIGGRYLEDFTQNPDDKPKAEWLYASGLSQYPGLWYINVWIPTGVVPAKEIPILLVYNNAPSTDGTIRTTINVQ